MSRTPHRPTFRPQAESLESRNLMAVFAVTNAHTAGGGSLTRAINDANLTRGADTIVFRIPPTPGQATQVIEEPRGGFPAITGKVTIDGFTQSGSQRNTSTNPALNNTRWGVLLLGFSSRPILSVEPGGSGTEIRGLVLGSSMSPPNNSAAGVLINRANLVKIDGDGFAAAENSGLKSAVTIEGGSFNTIGGDVAGTPALQNVMNSYTFGVTVNPGSKHNAVFGNIMGGQTSASGLLRTALYFRPGADNNTIVGNILINNQAPIVNGGVGNVFEGNIIVNT